MHCSEQLLETIMRAVASCFTSVNEDPVIFKQYHRDTTIDSTVSFMVAWLQMYCEPIKNRMISSLTPYVINLAPQLAICQRPFFLSSLLEKQAIQYYRTCTELYVAVRTKNDC